MRIDWQTDGAVWKWTGKQNARNGQTGNRQELWQAGNQALIPLVRYNSRLINYSNANAYIYTNHMAVGFHLLLSLFGFLLSIYLFIYII